MDSDRRDLEKYGNECVFTTHTPVPSGHDTFPLVCTESDRRSKRFCLDGVLYEENVLNMTYLALNLSRISTSCKETRERIPDMFAGFNRSHHERGSMRHLMSEPFQKLKPIHPFVEADNFSLRMP